MFTPNIIDLQREKHLQNKLQMSELLSEPFFARTIYGNKNEQMLNISPELVRKFED